MNFRTLLLSTILVYAFGAYAQTSGNKTTFNPLRLKATATHTISSGTKDDSMAYFYSGTRCYDKILDTWQFDSVKRYGVANTLQGWDKQKFTNNKIASAEVLEWNSTMTSLVPVVTITYVHNTMNREIVRETYKAAMPGMGWKESIKIGTNDTVRYIRTQTLSAPNPWVYASFDTFIYKNGLLLTHLTIDNAAPANNKRKVYTYNAAGKLQEVVAEVAGAGPAGWVPASRLLYSYSGDTVIVADQAFFNGGFMGYTRDALLYNDQNLPVLKMAQTWTNAKWTPYKVTRYYYENTFPTDVEEVKQAALDVSLYPVPASDLLHIRLDNLANEQLYFSVSNIEGKILKTWQAQASKTYQYALPVADMAPGHYILHMSSGAYSNAAQFTIVR